VTSLSEPVEMN